MWGGWSSPEEHRIVAIFGWSLGGFIVAMIVVIVGLLAGDPVGGSAWWPPGRGRGNDRCMREREP